MYSEPGNLIIAFYMKKKFQSMFLLYSLLSHISIISAFPSQMTTYNLLQPVFLTDRRIDLAVSVFSTSLARVIMSYISTCLYLYLYI